MKEEAKLDVIVATYHQDEPLKCLINCFKSQTSPDWNLYLIHDGEDDEYHRIKQTLVDDNYINQSNIVFDHTPKKSETPWGHESRDYGMTKYIEANSNVLLHTNGDNYYAPILVKYVLEQFSLNPDLKLFYWNMIHSHNNPGHPNFYPPGAGSYSLLYTELQHAYVDLGCVAIKNSVVKNIGFKHNEHDGDWFYFNDALDTLPHSISETKTEETVVSKSHKTLLVHN